MKMMTKDQVLALTEDQIELMAPKALVEAFNTIVAPNLQTKRFADRQAGQKRLRLMISAVRNGVERFASTPEDIEGGFKVTKETHVEETPATYVLDAESQDKSILEMPLLPDAVPLPGRKTLKPIKQIAKEVIRDFGKEKVRVAKAKAKVIAEEDKVIGTVIAKRVKVSVAKIKRVTVASMCRQLIEDGLDDREVWVAVKKHFNLDDSKRHYPNWYRAQINRNARKGTP
jgi:hypothetical protein